MKDLLGRGDAPTEADVVITFGEGPVWKYVLSGLPYLWVQGGLQFGKDDFTVCLTNIQALHDEICKHVLSRSTFSSAEFRFLRKEVGLTLDEFAFLSGLNLGALTDWEMGTGFAVEMADKRVREFYAMWKEGILLPGSHGRRDRRVAL